MRYRPPSYLGLVCCALGDVRLGTRERANLPVEVGARPSLCSLDPIVRDEGETSGTLVSGVPATILLGVGTLSSGRVRLGHPGTLELAGGSGSAAVRMQSRSDRRFYSAIKGLLLPA